MQSMVPLKKNLSSKDIVYIYLTGPSSPENIWKSNLSKKQFLGIVIYSVVLTIVLWLLFTQILKCVLP